MWGKRTKPLLSMIMATKMYKGYRIAVYLRRTTKINDISDDRLYATLRYDSKFTK